MKEAIDDIPIIHVHDRIVPRRDPQDPQIDAPIDPIDPQVKHGLSIERRSSKPGVDPFGSVSWELRDAVIRGPGGEIVFEQRGVEFPTMWSQNATNVVAQKYFRGQLGTPDREESVRSMIARVADTIAHEGRGLFTSPEDARAFRDELVHLLLHQRMAFNSPVWFNVGIDERPQCSACFINSVEDSMSSILDLAKTEATLFKHGSGTGTNLSALRSSRETLNGGGTASGPVSFMRGFDAFAGAIKSGGKTRRAAKMVILDADHPDVVPFIECKADHEKKAWALIEAGYDGNFNAPGGAYDTVGYQNANHSVRVTDEFMRAATTGGTWRTRAVTTGEVVEEMPAADLLRRMAEAAWICGDPGIQYHDTINAWHTCKASGEIVASNPCSEYMFLDDTACNLASLNLRAFQRDDASFDVAAFQHAVGISIIAMEILVGLASYPTKRIEENSHRYRTLGLGYANLGALLMSMGIPYDSDRGRAIAAAITSLMCGEAYLTSAMISRDATGPFPAYEENRRSVVDVVRKHASSASASWAGWESLRHGTGADGYGTDVDGLSDLFYHAVDVWSKAIILGEAYGFRHAQATVLAPTGTISFLMDCDTLGVEPDIALVKYKRLVGGGTMKIVNGTVESALRRLGHGSTIDVILAHVQDKGTVEGAAGLLERDYAVFDCALRPEGGERSISADGHLRMMAAVQPFLSGAISKTVNLPSDCTVADIQDVYVQAWKMGIKAIAVYRDGCKRTQPISTSAIVDSPRSTAVDSLDALAPAERRAVEEIRASSSRRGGPPIANRRRLPDERASITHKFSIGGHEGYVTVGIYEDGSPGEIFVRMAKEGSSIAGLMDSFGTVASIALQHGVPPRLLADKFRGTRFEPSGFTGNPNIPMATSIMDYLFRWLAGRFPSAGSIESAESGIEIAVAPSSISPTSPTSAIDLPPPIAHPHVIDFRRIASRDSDAPMCPDCGTLMMRSGTCHRCPNCGTTSGCS